ncbi:MAG: hypothetical protein C0518_02490 [Opitutus sp.]|nr:hypothetical protein [Opitutus sp.]
METTLVREAVQKAAGARRQADANEAFNALVELMPRLRHDPDRWELFVTLLGAAEAEDLIVLPARGGDGWNQQVSPARPKWVRLPAGEVRRESFDHRGFPWNPALAFLAGETCLPKGIREAALRLQQYWAAVGETGISVPIKERSWQIFGDEKRLESLLHSTILFGPGRLRLEQFACYVVEPTPVAERFPDGQGILIVENEASFDSFCRLARHTRTFGLVVYGRGHEILKCISYLRREAAAFAARPVSYFGDIDRRGLEIASQLTASLASACPVEPFHPGYAALLRGEAPAETAPPSCAWLPPGLRECAATVLNEGRRKPQEAFGWMEIAAAYGLEPHLR